MLKIKNTIINEIFSVPKEILVLRLTVILLLLHGSHSWTLDVPLRIICGIMLLSQTLIKNSTMWLILCSFLIIGNGLDWNWIDNHKYLITYWCMACTISVISKDIMKVLSWNARHLLGLVFFFAFIWKLIAGQYINGSFLHFVFMTDSRVEVAASFFGNLESSILPINRLLISALKDIPNSGIHITLETSTSLKSISLIASYWTLFIEGVLVLMFMLPSRFRLTKARDLFLILFIGTTYILLPVTGFAFILGVMGFAQCTRSHRATQIGYLSILVVIQLTRIPWQKFFLN